MPHRISDGVPKNLSHAATAPILNGAHAMAGVKKAMGHVEQDQPLTALSHLATDPLQTDRRRTDQPPTAPQDRATSLRNRSSLLLPLSQTFLGIQQNSPSNPPKTRSVFMTSISPRRSCTPFMTLASATAPLSRPKRSIRPSLAPMWPVGPRPAPVKRPPISLPFSTECWLTQIPALASLADPLRSSSLRHVNSSSKLLKTLIYLANTVDYAPSPFLAVWITLHNRIALSPLPLI